MLSPGISPFSSKNSTQIEAEEREEPATIVNVNGRQITLRQATCKRASREGRPREPSLQARIAARERIQKQEAQFVREGRRLLTTHDAASKQLRSSGQISQKINGRFPAPFDSASKITHLQGLKSRTADQFNMEPGYLLCDRTAELQYDRLTESALRANAGSQAVTKRKATQGASNQTPRINSRSIGMSAAVQCVNTMTTIALAEQKIRSLGIKVLNPMGTTAIDPCSLLFASASEYEQLFQDAVYLPVTATTELIYNSAPTKLGTSCIRAAATELARRELSEHLISRTMYFNHMLTSICRSVGGGYEIDSIWASIVLVVFLSYDPRGRRLLAASKLTDMDLQTAFILECYGRSEITRRVRLLDQQSREVNGKAGKKGSKRAKSTKSTNGNTSTADAEDHGQDQDDDHDHDHDEHDDRPHISGFKEMMAENEEEDAKTLGTKRRRSNKSLGSSSTCDSCLLIDWWFRALRSNQAAVLETMLASSRDTARQAAKSSLKRQAGENEDIAENKKLNGISMTTAVKSCEELVRLVHQPLRNTPMVVCARTKWHPVPVISTVKIPGSSNQTAIYACSVAMKDLQPCSKSAIVVLHASGMQEMMVRSGGNVLPCILERYSRIAEIRSDSSNAESGRGRRILSSIETFISEETKRPILATYAGMTRSFINIKMTVPITNSMQTSATCLSQEMSALYQKHKTSDSDHVLQIGTSCSIVNGASNGSYIRPPVAVLATSQDDSRRIEPLCTPCSRLAIGVRINELVKRWMTDRTRKNGIAVMVAGLHDPEDIPKDLGIIMDSEPVPMAIIVDFKMRVPDSINPAEQTFGTVGASLNVCLDGAIRAPELIFKTDELFERRALIIAASSQSSYISDAGAALSAQWANSSSASSKKVSCADLNTLLLLSIWDVYAGGLTNVHRNYTNTAYSGAYGSHIDTGITSPGLLANYYKADKRQHGTVSLGQEMADELCETASNSHFIPVGDSHYAVAPIQTRGIPHGFVPGLHTVLNDFHDAIETYRELTNRSDEPTVDGLFALPFSAFTQALAPDVESTVDLTIRHAFRDPAQCSVVHGRSYLSDTTSEDAAIFTEPLWRRPCQVCTHDNPFATAYGYADSMFNACCLISVMIVDIGNRRQIFDPELQVKYFHEFICRAVFTDSAPASTPDPASSASSASSPSSPSYLWACDFLVLLFGVIYPASHAIDQEVVPIEISTLASRMATKCKKQEKRGQAPVGVAFGDLLLPESVAKIQDLWGRFSKRNAKQCAWKNGIEALLILLVKNKGSHDVCRGMVDQMRSAVDAIPRSAWLVYSVDGSTPPAHPNPLCECASPEHVQRTHLDPIFCAMGTDLELEPRGALVGLQPFQMRQIYALMLGSHLKNAKPQVVRNEGGLNLRLSSAADILEQDGRQRSEKAISPLQVEADFDAFGNRDSKLYGAALQRSAWDKNVKLLSPILTRLQPPQDTTRRSRGEWGEAQWLSKFLQDELETNRKVHDVENLSRHQIERAAHLGANDFSWAQ